MNSYWMDTDGWDKERRTGWSIYVYEEREFESLQKQVSD